MHRPILMPVAIAVSGGIRQELEAGWAINDAGMLVNLRQNEGDEPPDKGVEVIDAMAIERDVDVTRLDDVIRIESTKENFIGMLTGGGNIHEYARAYAKVMMKKTFISNFLIHRIALLVNRLANNHDLATTVNLTEWKDENRQAFVEAISHTRKVYLKELLDLVGEMHREIWAAFAEVGLRKDGFGIRDPESAEPIKGSIEA